MSHFLFFRQGLYVASPGCFGTGSVHQTGLGLRSACLSLGLPGGKSITFKYSSGRLNERNFSAHSLTPDLVSPPKSFVQLRFPPLLLRKRREEHLTRDVLFCAMDSNVTVPKYFIFSIHFLRQSFAMYPLLASNSQNLPLLPECWS